MIISAKQDIYNISLKSINNENIDLNNFRGKYMLFVNVASYCGFTHQYTDLQNLYDTYDCLEVIGLPCNQFLFQEPFSNKKIKKFCTLNYNITFLMTEKIYVKGKNQHDIYKWLTDRSLNGLKNSVVKWNFQKYLIGKEGNLIDFFHSKISPISEHITKHLN